MKKEFNSVKEMYKWLTTNKSELIKMKKAQMKNTEPFVIVKNGIKVKALTTNYTDQPETGVITRTIIGNTYNWMDSQKDVLLANCFAKSISERQKDIWHLRDHEYSIAGKVGRPKSIYEKTVAWKDLGIDKEGDTMCLMLDGDIIKDYNAAVFAMYLNNEVNQHSVGMQYVELSLAINDPEYKEEFADWNKYIDTIGNKDDVMEDGYFWAVKQGKLLEVSAVLRGANELTPTLENKAYEDELKKNSGKNIQPDDFYLKLAEHIKASGL